MSFISESISQDFGVINGQQPEQTLLSPFDVYSGFDLSPNIFQNTLQSLEEANQDKRITLGMFSFVEDNLAKDNFPNILSAPFVNYNKPNLVQNGDCKFVEKVLCRFVVPEGDTESTLYPNDTPIVVRPEGDWAFIPFKNLDNLDMIDFYDDIENAFRTNKDSQGMGGYGGRYAYVPFSIENEKDEVKDDGTPNDSYWGNLRTRLLDSATANSNAQHRIFFGVNATQSEVEEAIDGIQGNILNTYRLERTLFRDGTDLRDKPHVAMWLNTPEAYSNNRCLSFTNYQIWNWQKIVNGYGRVGTVEISRYIFNYLLDANVGFSTAGVPSNYLHNLITDNQYRVLNQFTKIYDKFNDSPINPYSSLKIRFKMKTTLVLPPTNNTDDFDVTAFKNNPLDESLNLAPKVEVGILSTQFNEIPLTGNLGIHPFISNLQNEFDSPGSFNSTRYYNVDKFEDRKNALLGGMIRVQNKQMNEWENFEFIFNLTDEHLNKGRIYGVPYGGSFADDINNGSTEIILNTNFANQTPSPNPGEIFFRVPNYQETSSERLNDLFFKPPSIINVDSSFSNQYNETYVYMNHDNTRDGVDYMTVVSGLGVQTKTGKQEIDDEYPNQEDFGITSKKTIFLEAYLMYIGGNQQQLFDLNFIKVNDGSQYENLDGTDRPHMIVAYWDGERWSYDKGGTEGGYKSGKTQHFNPNEECFILARLYASDIGNGITSIDQYISNEVNFPTDGLGNLFLFLQSGNNFQGRVLIDDIECYESYDFVPEVDVRKKISVGNYGKADLTKYYDAIIHGPGGTNEYKDSVAPLEAQFYFYPQYPTDEIFTERTPIYQDFKQGRFYIYDINWGDGSNNEFTSTPEQIDENTSLYHTYETHGIFEVTGTMIRVKVDENDDIQGVVNNKKFKLRININEGLDEDFTYFGSDGYSFIPYKNTTPIIGGISKQSTYYKKIKRQLGFLNNEKINIDFKYKSDKLKTEIALLKMENQNFSDLEVLPPYTEERFSKQFTDIPDLVDYYKNPTIDSDEINSTLQFLSTLPFPKYREEFLLYNNGFEGVAQLYFTNLVRNDIGGFIYYLGLCNSNNVNNEMMYDALIFYHGDIFPDFIEDYFLNASSLIQNGKSGGDLIPSIYDTPTIPQDSIISSGGGEKIYNGINFITEELGKSLGDCDITNIKYYDEPKSIWELFGFEDAEFNEIGNPNNERYWKKIIPQNYSIFNRDGINITNDNNFSIDTFAEQEWIDNFYYPVLPRYKSNGEFLNIEFDDDNNILPNIYPNNKIPFPTDGIITNEDESEDNLIINIINEKLESDVFMDKSGNENVGMVIEDFNADFDSKTLKVKKIKPSNIIKTGKVNGAF